MHQLEFKGDIDILDRSELEKEYTELIEKAESACKRAYAPYSGFSVGAALLTTSGDIHTGNNQENAAYPSGLCAERVAVFSAMSKDPEYSIKAIAIVTGTDIDQPVSPCGACRQVIYEYEYRQGEAIVLLLVQGNSIYKVPSVKTLLPLAFSPEILNLKKS